MNALMRLSCLAVLIVAAAARGQSTQPVRTDQQISADLEDTSKKLGEVLRGAKLDDANARAKIAPEATPLLKRMIADVDAISTAPEMAKKQARVQLLPMLSVLGDQDATNALSAMAASADPQDATAGQIAQVTVQWLLAGLDAAAQGKVVDEFEKLDQAHSDSNDLTQLTFGCAQRTVDPALKLRLIKAAIAMSSPVATEIRQEVDAESQADAKLATMENKPLAIAGKQVNNEPFTTADWKGKVVLVDFWATWCPMCEAELPRVRKIYGDFHVKGLEVVGVSNDYDTKVLNDYTTANQMPWPQLFDANAAAAHQWNSITLGNGILGLPKMFLIDKKGVLRSTTAEDNMETLIPQLLAE
jgi:peroxiredoxin